MRSGSFAMPSIFPREQPNATGKVTREASIRGRVSKGKQKLEARPTRDSIASRPGRTGNSNVAMQSSSHQEGPMTKNMGLRQSNTSYEPVANRATISSAATLTQDYARTKGASTRRASHLTTKCAAQVGQSSVPLWYCRRARMHQAESIAEGATGYRVVATPSACTSYPQWHDLASG